MKIQIRQGVFETNSSSTHAISICSKAEWDAFNNGDMMINIREDLKLLPVKEALEWNENEVIRYTTKGWGHPDDEDLYMTSDQYWDLFSKWCYEYFKEVKTIGDTEVVAFGYYGNDY